MYILGENKKKSKKKSGRRVGSGWEMGTQTEPEMLRNFLVLGIRVSGWSGSVFCEISSRVQSR